MPTNRIDAILTDEQRDQFTAALAAMTGALPFLLDLSPKERKESVKFGEKNRSFVAKGLVVAEGHPEILPASFNLVTFRHDVDLIERLYPLLSALEALYGKLQDTYFAAGSDAYAAALTVYHLTTSSTMKPLAPWKMP
ncbi:hypothetical protein [uncultured Thiodictyon sp.]|uniref:hypothetical protein n=1 Tax=uncultured Thiodictyon sp. TaxID=1846217 RepID=UPI0025D395AC|nr:hypothetical protein [uncultured Thiodictyon sp.]